jgi:hypothetical protein
MAFIRKKVATYKWPVTIESPVDGGIFERETFDAVFKRIGRTEFQKLVDAGDMELLGTVLVGWDGINDESEKPVPYSPSNCRELFDDPYFVKGLIKAYLESLEGAKAKN